MDEIGRIKDASSDRCESMRCGICDEQVPSSLLLLPWNNPHWKSLHPEYVKWSKRWFRVSLATIPPLIAAYIVFMYYWLDVLIPGQETSGNFDLITFMPVLYATLLYAGPVLIMILYGRKKRPWFRKAWRKEHLA